jgi:tetratricopeptide (TPR) repeat protein
MRGDRKTPCLFLGLLLLFLIPAWANDDARSTSTKLGSLSFLTSCNPDVQTEFLRGVALLHSFAYSEAEMSFKTVAKMDPDCAIARWGVAMTYFHQLWDPSIQQDTFAKGREEIQSAQKIKASSDRERRFIHALALFYEQDFRAVPYHERITKYERAMAALAAAYPGDTESQVFHALALLANASPFDKSHTKQKRAAKILAPLFEKFPQHPGIAHYLIHACDNQEMARQGLAAALAYSKIAPDAPHALHMPSHIFTRLGMWSDSVASNRAARVAAHNHGDIGEELHSMDYLVYAYLQEGREKEAGEIIQQLKAMSELDKKNFKVAYAATAMPLRYAVERRRWEDAAMFVPPEGAPPHVIAVAVWARAVGLARSGQPSGARAQLEKLQQLEQQLLRSQMEYGGYWAKQVGVLKSEVCAWSDQAEGKVEEARKLLRRAADEEDAVEKLPVTPGPVSPAREQLGDLLLEQHQPKMALQEYQTALRNSPNRRAALDGSSRAAAEVGNGSSHK